VAPFGDDVTVDIVSVFDNCILDKHTLFLKDDTAQ